MTAAVLYGSEDLRDREHRHSAARARRSAGAREGRAHLRHRPQGLEARLSRPHDHAAGRVRPRVGRRHRTGWVATLPSSLHVGDARGAVELRALRRLPVLPQGAQQSLRGPALQQRRLRRIHPHSRTHRPAESAGDPAARLVPGRRDGRAAGLRSARHRRNRHPAWRHDGADRLRPDRPQVHSHAGRPRRATSSRWASVPIRSSAAERMGARAAFDVSKLSDPDQPWSAG